MGCNSLSTVGSITHQHVEHACGNSGLMHSLRKEVCTNRRHLARLQNNGATHQHRWEDFSSNLVQRIVPWGDAANHADRFAHNQRSECHPLLKLDHVDKLQAGPEVEVNHVDLHVLGKRRRAAQLFAEPLRGLSLLALPRLQDFEQDRLAFVEGLFCPGRKRLAGRSNGLLHILCTASGHARANLASVGIDHIAKLLRRGRSTPLAVDVHVFPGGDPSCAGHRAGLE
mmetsp:Transcript_71126/g.169799  ORF Transcript_71126/g.169799 Transcript_71126/m.169799 type:complete len:227 (+) Transcript_71126:930-1610(+)